MSTYHSLHYHLIFSTKYRRPWITGDWIDRLHAYLGGTVKGLGAVPENVGGVEDHVHLLIGCKPVHRPSDFTRELKKAATAWVHQEIGLGAFAWQQGYAILSVSPSARASVAAYIDNQAAHHRKKTFIEELTEILERAGIEYDPRFLE